MRKTGIPGGLVQVMPRARCNDAVALPPPVQAYEAWLQKCRDNNPKGYGRLGSDLTASKVRRAVILRRAHDTYAEIGRCIGMTMQGTKSLFSRIPEELK